MSTKKQSEKKLRKAIIRQCLWMNDSGLNQGTSGNISARLGNKLIITPSGVPYDKLKPSMLASVSIDKDGEPDWSGKLPPSSEWRFHLDIIRARPEAGAIVHTHSPHATALAMLRKPIPACHYMIAAFGGDDIRCAGYARYGTEALSKLALAALEGRTGCLLANHGMITVGETLDKAMWLAVELEALARQYLLALNAGKPVLLSAAQIAETAAAFANYGLRDPDAATATAPVAAPADKSPWQRASREPAGGSAAAPVNTDASAAKDAVKSAATPTPAEAKPVPARAKSGGRKAAVKPASKPVTRKSAKPAAETASKPASKKRAAAKKPAKRAAAARKTANSAKTGPAAPRQRRLI